MQFFKVFWHSEHDYKEKMVFMTTPEGPAKYY